MKIIKINIKLSLILITTMLFVSLESVKAQGNLILNGTFDSDLSEWTTVGVVNWEPWYGGSASLSGPSSSISQTIYNLDVGTTYIVSGDYYSVDGWAPLNVSVDGFSQLYVATSSWQSFSFSFTASSPTVTLSFLVDQKVICSLDNISMFAVPEPNSLCLLGMGAASSLFFLRRRR